MKTPMTSREKVLSYLRNRAGEPVTNEQIAIGARLKLGTVGPLIARLIDEGHVLRLAVKKPNRAGREMSTVVLAANHTAAVAPAVVARRKPMPRKDLSLLVDCLEEAANLVLTSLDDPDGPRHQSALDLLRILRDDVRALKNQYLASEDRAIIGREGYAATLARIEGGRLLDWLYRVGDKTGWQARESTTGRGWRLHQPGPHQTPHDALRVTAEASGSFAGTTGEVYLGEPGSTMERIGTVEGFDTTGLAD